MTTTELTTDPLYDFREKLTIMVALQDLSLNHARRILAHVKERYPNGNTDYCKTIIDKLKRDRSSRRMKMQKGQR